MYLLTKIGNRFNIKESLSSFYIKFLMQGKNDQNGRNLKPSMV